MLRRLRIENLAIFDRAEAELEAGLNVISGETGAGKTLLVEAIRLIAGAKADPALIGPRGEEAYVEAEFDDPPPAAVLELVDPDEPLVLARRLRRSGQSRTLISGRSGSAAQAAEAAEQLLSLTGQHAARRLASPRFQLELIDRAAGAERELAVVGAAFAALREAENDLGELRAALIDRERQLEILRHELELITATDPNPDEERELEGERERLRNADTLRELTAGAHADLSGDGAALERVSAARAALERAADHDAAAAKLALELEAIADGLADATTASRELAEGYTADPDRLEGVEQRLLALAGLRRRFGGADIAAIVARVAPLEAEIAALESGEERVAELEQAHADAEADYEQAAQKLGGLRRRAARKLARSAAAHLDELGLAGAELVIEFEPAPRSALGTDRVSIRLRANRGLEPAPLDRGASGGELSRVSLALLLAVEESSDSAVESYVFDEVDAGIGGQTAHTVAAKLAALAERAQVIVITHLAQIAVRADRHLVIVKDDADAGGLTRASLKPLESAEERSVELARLVGADGAAAGEQAEQLLREAARL